MEIEQLFGRINRKYLRVFTVVLAGLLLLIVIANFGINAWLKYRLPAYIKNNSAYTISYKSLDISLATGNVISKGFRISTKKKGKNDVLGIEGTVDSLAISRVGFYDLLLNKSFSSANITLVKPNLLIHLPKKNSAKAKKKNGVSLKHFAVSQGNITVFNPVSEKILEAKNLEVELKNLDFSGKKFASQLPFLFDSYQFSASSFFYRPNEIYTFTAVEVNTKDAKILLKQPRYFPVEGIPEVKVKFPNVRTFVKFAADSALFADIAFKKSQVSLKEVYLYRPETELYATGAAQPPQNSKKTPDLLFDQIIVRDAALKSFKPNGNLTVAVENLTGNITKFALDATTRKEKKPFAYADFKLTSKNLKLFTRTDKIIVGTATLLPKNFDLRQITIQSLQPAPHATDLRLAQAKLQIDDWSFRNSKLRMQARHLLVNGLEGTIAPNSKKTGANKASGIDFPLQCRQIDLKNSSINIQGKKWPLSLQGISATLKNVQLAEKNRGGVALVVPDYTAAISTLQYRTRFYNMSASKLKLTNKNFQATNVAVLPTVSRGQFVQMIPEEKDLYDIKAAQISGTGHWDFLAEKSFAKITSLHISGADAVIFRSKIPKDDLREKPLYSALLRNMKFPLLVQNLHLKNSRLVYEEDTKKSDGPGKLVFGNFNLTGQNIHSGMMKTGSTKIPLNISCSFMNASPMKVRWILDTANLSDAFSISGKITGLQAADINPFIEPYLKITATGMINELLFDFKGNRTTIGGPFQLKHENLKIAVLREDGDKNKVLTALANLLVRSDSGKLPSSVTVENVERDPTKSFFNLFWRGVEQGLKKTLIGITKPKEENAAEKLEKTKEKLKTVPEAKVSSPKK